MPQGSLGMGILAGLVLLMVLLFVLAASHRRALRRLEERFSQDAGLNLLAEWMRSMDQSIQSQTRTVSEELRRVTESIAQRLDNASRVLTSVGEAVGRVHQVGEQIQAFQELLRGPKFRGLVGEEILRDLIEQVLPVGTFAFQHRFSTGVVVDAVIKTEGGMIPIDSKFPLDSFRSYYEAEEPVRDLAWRQFAQAFRKHINDVSSKYIRPREGTLDFALLYVPSEPVYYEIIARDSDLPRHARSKRVFLVSPNGFYYFLQVILLGFQARHIEEAARQLLASLENLREEAKQVTEELDTLRRHLNQAQVCLDRVRRAHDRLSRELESLEQPPNLEEGPRALPRA